MIHLYLWSVEEVVKYYGFILQCSAPVDMFPNHMKSSSIRQISACKAVDISAVPNPSVYSLKGERASIKSLLQVMLAATKERWENNKV